MKNVLAWDFNTFVVSVRHDHNAAIDHKANYQIYCDIATKKLEMKEVAVGDIVFTQEGKQRVGHIWGDDSIQPGDCDGSFYISSNDGLASMSGSLYSAIPKSKFRKLAQKEMALFWFFSRNWARAHCGIYVELPVNVWIID